MLGHEVIHSETPTYIPLLIDSHVEFKQGKKIGDGGFSTVFKGLWISRQIEVAIKIFEGLSTMWLPIF